MGLLSRYSNFVPRLIGLKPEYLNPSDSNVFAQVNDDITDTSYDPNYIVTEIRQEQKDLTDDEIQQVFDRVSLFAQPGGLFLFDMNTLYKHHEILKNKIFLYDTEQVFCTWENHLHGDTVEMQLTFFAHDDEQDCYYRSDEFIKETAYDNSLIENAIRKAGLVLLAEFDADADLDAPEQFSLVSDKTERILFVTQKP